MRNNGLQLLLLICALVANFFAACSAQTAAANDQPTFKKYETAKIETTKDAVVAISKVKAPIYAVRSLVVKGFRDSIPEYKAVKGLTFKAYSLSDDGKFFGGVYYWKNAEDAKNWFNWAWFERVAKKYGVAGTVDYYTVSSVANVAEILQPDAAFCTVLSLSKDKIAIDKNAVGLIKIIEVADANKQTGAVTIWNSKQDAENYFAKSSAVNTFFDSPILLDNEKQ